MGQQSSRWFCGPLSITTDYCELVNTSFILVFRIFLWGSPILRDLIQTNFNFSAQFMPTFAGNIPVWIQVTDEWTDTSWWQDCRFIRSHQQPSVGLTKGSFVTFVSCRFVMWSQTSLAVFSVHYIWFFLWFFSSWLFSSHFSTCATFKVNMTVRCAHRSHRCLASQWPSSPFYWCQLIYSSYPSWNHQMGTSR